MILRALFWVGVVAVFMPHEPDLGLGRPAATLLPPAIANMVDSFLGAPQKACHEHAQGCAGTLGVIDALQGAAISSLAQVKAEIEASERQSTRRGGSG
ncbi:MAG: hypothetical protein KGL26_02885 [Pseudomonadota bacterium]|nr:hypothetical protein [Pseudomonadota bacterium]